MHPLLKTGLCFLFILAYKCAGQVPTGSQPSYEAPFKRFEYKYSFKGPYLAQKDNTVPFWEYHGSAIASEDMVRITPSLKSQKGTIWTKQKTNFDAWEVEMWFRITGKTHLGADGIAFWFTEEKANEGNAFGAPERFRGLGIFFDSYNNDGSRDKNDGPQVMAMVNDGTKVYDHNTDGRHQMLAGCIRHFRNKPFPVRAKIEYNRNVLTLLIHSGENNIDDRYELCFRAENVYLPQSGYFGVSAATGALADDHDVLKFLAYSLGTKPPTAGIADPEKDKFTKEYQDYKTKLEKQQEEYFKSHPEEEKKYREKEGMSPEREYDSNEQRALHQIFTGQSQIAGDLVSINRKLDELLGRQERALSLLSNLQYGVGAPQGGQPGPGAHVPLPIQRHEVEALLANQQEVVRNVREIKATGNQNQQPASVQASSFHQQLLTEIRDSVNVLRKDLNEVGVKLQHNIGAKPSVSCPSPVNCLSSTHFFIFMSIHLAILLGFAIYKSNKESQAKKFY